MRILNCAVLLLIAAVMPTTIRAQARAEPDSAQMVAMTATAMQMTKPAEFILKHRTDLALTAQQVSRLEALVVAQRDSNVVRLGRRTGQLLAKGPSAQADLTTSWTGDIDERALREELCRQSANQIDARLALGRDRRAAAAVLTPGQVGRLPHLESDAMMKAFKRP